MQLVMLPEDLFSFPSDKAKQNDSPPFDQSKWIIQQYIKYCAGNYAVVQLLIEVNPCFSLEVEWVCGAAHSNFSLQKKQSKFYVTTTSFVDKTVWWPRLTLGSDGCLWYCSIFWVSSVDKLLVSAKVRWETQ